MLNYETLNKLARQNSFQESLISNVKGGVVAEHIPEGCCILED